jgi:hypothetical protein
VATSFGQLATFNTGGGAVTTRPPSVAGVSAVDPNLNVGRSMQYSLSVQRERPYGILGQAAYVGNQGRSLLRGPNINAPTWAAANLDYSVNPSPNSGLNNPPPCAAATPHCLTTNQIRPYLGWGDIPQERSDVTSNYNSLQLSGTKRKGIVSTTLSYTFSKVLTEGGGVGDAYNENPEPECPFTCLLSNGQTVDWKRFQYGKASFDRTHIFSASYTLESPWFRNSKGIVGGALGGWELSGITRYQSGAPLTITASAPVGTGLSSFSRRGSVVPGQALDDLPRSGGACPVRKICWFDGARVQTGTRHQRWRRTYRQHHRPELLLLGSFPTQEFQVTQRRHEPDVSGGCVQRFQPRELGQPWHLSQRRCGADHQRQSSTPTAIRRKV